MVFVGLLESRMVEWEWGYPTTMCAPDTSYSYAVPTSTLRQSAVALSVVDPGEMCISSREYEVESRACLKHAIRLRGESLLRGGLMYTSPPYPHAHIAHRSHRIDHKA